MTARPRRVARGALSAAWLTVARRGGDFARARARSLDRASSTHPAPPQHHRQEHRAHEDQPDRKRDHRRDRRRHQGARPAATAASGGKPLVIVESPTKANKIAGYLGSGYVVEASVGHIRDLPAQRRRRPGRAQGRRVGAARRRRRQLLRAALRRQPRPQAAGQPAQAADEGRQRGLPRDRRGPRGRGHRLAPGRHPQAPGAGAPDGLPRDHPRGDRPRRRQPARARHRPGRRPGDPPHPRPALRLRGQPGALEEGPAEAVGRARAVGGHPDRRRARAGADGVPRRRLLVARGHLRRPEAGRRDRRGRADDGPRHAGQRRRQPGRHRPRLRRRPPAGSPATSCTSTRPAPAGSPPGSRAARSSVSRVDEKPYRRRPYAPFTTSTLQMDAGRKLGWSSAQTMRVAQRLYENGHITYMRTDSTNLSEEAINAARQQARELYGDAYVPAEARRYKSKAKGAQEAHEAIRPAGDNFRTPGQLAAAAGPRRVPALRAGLAAHGRLADGRRGRADGEHPAGRAQRHRRGGRVHRQRPHDHLPRLPQGLRGVARREHRPPATTRAATTPSAGCRGCERGQQLDTRELDAEGPHHHARRPATPSRAWSPGSRSWASAARRPTRRSCRRSRTAGTSGRRATRSCPRSSPSPW